MKTKVAFLISVLFFVAMHLSNGLHADQQPALDASKTKEDCSDPCASKTESCSGEAEVAKGMAYCSAFSACSIDRDLRAATKEELKEYKAQKELDGRTFLDKLAENFEAIGTDGSTIRLSQFRGKPVALLFLAVHCNHSQDTLPILTELKKDFEPKGLIILPVYVHTGIVADLKEYGSFFNLDFPLFMVGKDVSLRFENKMVPTVFLIDERGYIVQEFVGYKKHSVLSHAFENLVKHGSGTDAESNSSR